MFRQQDESFLPSLSEIQRNDKKHHRTLYAIIAVFAVLIVIIAMAFLISQNGMSQSDSSSMELCLNYAVGEHMVYEITSTSSSYPETTSITTIMDVLSENSENYTIAYAFTTNPDIGLDTSQITIDVSKASYYNNFMVTGGPLIFNDVSNPTILAYLAQPNVKVGEVWIIPLNTDGTRPGLIGEVTLKFAETQELTVPAGTFQTMRIEITSNVLTVNLAGSAVTDSLSNIISSMSTQLNGTTYIELGTCRLIKADLTQLITINGSSINTNSTAYSTQTLMEYTKP